MFLDAVADPKLDPMSEIGISVYNYETTSRKGEVCSVTGLRSGLNRSITRVLPDSLLPALSTSDYLLCCDHMFTRITATLLTLSVKSIFSLEAESVIYKKDRDCALKHLESYINLRCVRSGHFKFYFEPGKNKRAPVSSDQMQPECITPAATTPTGTGSDITTSVEGQALETVETEEAITMPHTSNELGCLTGRRFLVAGSLQPYKLSHEKLTELIKSNGGQVLKMDNIPNGLHASENNLNHHTERM